MFVILIVEFDKQYLFQNQGHTSYKLAYGNMDCIQYKEIGLPALSGCNK